MEVYTFSSPRPQNFSLPYSMLGCIFPLMWSQDVYQKLTLTCRYFFATHRILVVPNIKIENDQRPVTEYYLQNTEKERMQYIGKEIHWHLETTKLWVRDTCQFINQQESISSVLKYLFSNKPTATCLHLQDCYIKYDEFKMLAEHFNRLSMDRCVIQDMKENPVSLGDIMDVIPNILHFTYEPLDIQNMNFRQSSTNRIPILPKLVHFSFRCESFNPEDFCDFVSLHPGRKFRFFAYLQAAQVESIISALCLKFPEGVATHPLEEYHGLWVFKFDTTVVEIF